MGRSEKAAYAVKVVRPEQEAHWVGLHPSSSRVSARVRRSRMSAMSKRTALNSLFMSCRRVVISPLIASEVALHFCAQRTQILT